MKTRDFESSNGLCPGMAISTTEVAQFYGAGGDIADHLHLKSMVPELSFRAPDREFIPTFGLRELRSRAPKPRRAR